MKKKIYIRFMIMALISFLPNWSSAQETAHKALPGADAKNVKQTFNEKEFREMLIAEGYSEQTIDKLIEQKKAAPISFPIVDNDNVQKSDNNLPVPLAACGDMGGENGWGTWLARLGYHKLGFNGDNPFYFSPAPPIAPRHLITAGAGSDACTPGGGGPVVPIVCPGFGNGSIRMGEPSTNGVQGGCSSNGPYPPPTAAAFGNGCSEQLEYQLSVTAQDSNFIYAYSVFLENPPNGHTDLQAPYAEIYMLDANGDTVPCSHRKYSADLTAGTPPGFFLSSCLPSSAGSGSVTYKPWTLEGINLKSYIGQTLKVVITNTDCALGGHACWSYWDFSCGTLSTNPATYCPGQSVSITAPNDPAITYSYQWLQNGNVYTGAPGPTSPTITPFPQPGDTFSVHVIQPSGCNFYLVYVPLPLAVTAAFSFTGTCSQMSFTDGSTTPSTSNPITNWSWQFPGGTPATSTSQNPGPIQYPPGSYTVTMIVTSAGGCTSTSTHSFTMGGFPTAAFNSTPPCLGSTVQLTDGSVAAQGDAISSWNWGMPGGNPASSSSQNTATAYTSAGTHSVTLIVTTQNGCKDTIVQQVVVYNPPVANFSGPAAGCAPVCNNYTDMSTSTDGNVTSWLWNFPGGTPSWSLAQDPQNICYYSPGSYGATLIVTNSYGCKDTLVITPLVTVHPWPKAEFCVSPAQAPATDPVFNLCDMWSNDVVQWTWNFGDGDTDMVSTDPVHSYSSTVTGNDFYTYDICINVKNQFGCWDTTCHTVELIPEFTFYIPNTFTPNGDFMNEVFFGKGRGIKEYNIWLFDRWGNQIWDCHYDGKNTNWDNNGQDGMSSFCKWDGKVVNGGLDMSGNSRQLAQEDVYVWKVRLTDVFDKDHSYVGHVSIVR